MVNVSGESDPFTLINDGSEFDKYFLDYQNKLTSNVASMMNTILVFRKGLIHSSDFEDEDSLWLHLSRVVNHLLGVAKAEEAVGRLQARAPHDLLSQLRAGASS